MLQPYRSGPCRDSKLAREEGARCINEMRSYIGHIITN